MKNIFYNIILLVLFSTISSFAKSNDKKLMDSCNNGAKKSCYELGLKYFDDTATDKIVKGTMLLNQACNMKYSPACVVLGYFFYDGKRIAEDYKQASHYFWEAHTLKDAGGCLGLADMYEKGKGVKKDPYNAYVYQDAACRNGAPYSCYEVGQAYEKGNVIEKDTCMALKYYEIGCALKISSACEDYERLKVHKECIQAEK